MVPEAIVMLEEMPITANGKDRSEETAGPERRRRESGEYVAPRTPVEEMLVGIFEEVLKLDRVGNQDNFFEIGGHSLLATQVVSRVRRRFGVEIGVRSIFEEPTVEGAGAKDRGGDEGRREGGGAAAGQVARRAKRRRRLPLSFAQQRLWFLDQLEPEQPFYNIPGAVRLEGRLDLEALERVINEIVRRHEVLRTRIEVEEGEPAQVIDEWEPRRLEVEDLTGLTREREKEEARRIAREEAETGFDLSRGPLLRVKVLKLEEEEHVLLFTMHHIVSDGWSMGILIRESRSALSSHTARERSRRLPELPIQYADYAVWQRE